MSSCVKETNEGLDDKNSSAITGENSQTMLLGQLKHQIIAHHKKFAQGRI